ncbi:MAG: hypothetical protein HY817_02640 [Candidatus Abawacabacteria bacterium]|nr:hypothetical protein [Candidatus Abawacabacteria bacterium]
MDRKFSILKAIIETFIKEGGPVGSQYLLDEFDFSVSPATVRNDMMLLEKAGLIYQPHTSAGRVPTEKGLRYFIDQMMDEQHIRIPQSYLQQLNHVQQMQEKIASQKAEKAIYTSVGILAKITDEVSFATLPWLGETYYLGLANAMRKPEFADSARFSTVVEVLEDQDHFLELLESLNLSHDVTVLIGKENIIEAIKGCSLLATQYEMSPEYSGIIGILGAMRMNYPRNIAALTAVRNDLEKTHF